MRNDRSAHAVKVLDYGREGDLAYIVMKYVEGGTLKERLGEPLPLDTTVDTLSQVAGALDHAHRQGVIHRDVKPSNVLISEGGWAFLGDFGLARMAVVLKHITAPLPSPRKVDPAIPEAVERVVLKAMAKDPADRYQSAGELTEALKKAARGMDGRTYPWGDAFDGSKLNFCDKNCPYNWKDASVDDGHAGVAPMGSYPAGASPYGVLDMAGNAWEWVADWYWDDYYSRSPDRNPPGPDSGTYRVMRGGSWDNVPHLVRGANRAWRVPDYQSFGVGFRCAMDSEPSGPFAAVWNSVQENIGCASNYASTGFIAE